MSDLNKLSERQRFWLGVASKNHVMVGVRHGFAQVNHGKRAPLMRMRPGDGLVYYSPSLELGAKATLQSFTAIGVISEGLEQVTVSEEFCPWRRTVCYRTGVHDAPVSELKTLLELTSKPNWGYQLRMGLVELVEEDFLMIEGTMLQPVTSSC